MRFCGTERAFRTFRYQQSLTSKGIGSRLTQAINNGIRRFEILNRESMVAVGHKRKAKAQPTKFCPPHRVSVYWLLLIKTLLRWEKPGKETV